MNRIIILAAGKGTRMKSDKPKVLVEVNGKPMLKYLLESVFKAGVDLRPIIVVSPDNVDLIKNTIPEYDVDYAIQKEQLGTGHAVACALETITGKCNKVLVFNGDSPFIKPESIKKLSDTPGTLTMFVTELEDFADWRQAFYQWGRIIINNDFVEKIIEFKDSDDEEKEIKTLNPAMYAFGYEWLKSNIKNIKNENAQKEYYLTDMVALAFTQNIPINAILIDAKESMAINSAAELEIAENVLKEK